MSTQTKSRKRRSFRRAWSEWERRKRATTRTLLRPPPRLSLAEWADKHRHLSGEASAEPGPWRTSRAPYLREIMDVLTDPAIRRMVWMAASQVGKTEVGLNLVGYHIHLDPAPILVVQPTLDMAETWSKDRLATMLRDSPVLQGLVRPARARDSDNTILHKRFPGGHITIVGSNSAAGLSSRPIRLVIFDEVDRYEGTSEGSTVKMGEQRTRTFWNKKIAEISSPRLKGGRMERQYKRSDQRRYYVPCPHCEHYQVLRWGGPDESYGIRWETEIIDGETVHHFETAAYLCESCGTLVEEFDKTGLLAAGEWRAENPRGAFPGFHLNALYSPWARWAELAEEFVSAKRAGPEELQTFVNLQLGEPWDEDEHELKPDDLAARREAWPADVPDGVGVLTAGVDVQEDRLEVVVKGWGADEESWLTLHERIHGDPEKDDVWERLEAVRTRAYRHESGAELRIRVMAIDSGFSTDRVYGYVKPRQLVGVYAMKGMDSRASEMLKRASKPNRYGIKLWTLNTVKFKDIMFRRLRLRRPGPGYMHFCQQTATGADAEYFVQFTAEAPKLVRTGRKYRREYVQKRDRNEAIDLEVLALAALHTLGATVRKQLGQLADEARSGRAPGPKRKRRRVRSKGVQA